MVLRQCESLCMTKNDYVPWAWPTRRKIWLNITFVKASNKKNVTSFWVIMGIFFPRSPCCFMRLLGVAILIVIEWYIQKFSFFLFKAFTNVILDQIHSSSAIVRNHSQSYTQPRIVSECHVLNLTLPWLLIRWEFIFILPWVFQYFSVSF